MLIFRWRYYLEQFADAAMVRELSDAYAPFADMR